MTEGKPIAKPMIDDATREKMALMFSGEVYLPDDVGRGLRTFSWR